GPTGSEKTFLYLCLLYKVWLYLFVVLTTALSDISVLIMPEEQTAHSQFNIPLTLNLDSTCAISKQSQLASLLHLTRLIIWDKILIIHHYTIEALDQTFKDLIECNLLFNSKIVVFDKDFY
ncbi:15759_t:CDS:1, partial [Cetraspora pellucida]